MKLKNIFLVILYQIILLLRNTRSDHVQVIGCSKEPRCLHNINQQLLNIIEENLETRTQPCENFWNYTCGSWTSAPYYDHMDNFGAMANYYANNLIETLKELQNHDLKISNLVDQLMKYYKACTNLNNSNLNFGLYLKELPSKTIFGQIFKWDQLFLEDIWQEFDWLNATAFLRRYGFKNLFLEESAGFHRRNSQQCVVKLKIPHPKISFHNKYQVLQIMEQFDLMFSLNTCKNSLKLAGEIVEFDNKLQNLYEAYKTEKENYQILLQDLPILFRRMDWHSYFQLLLNKSLPTKTVVEFSGNLDYFKGLEILFKETPKSIQGTYTLLKFCQYLTEIRPTITERECMLHTNVMFPMGVNYIYDRFLYENRIKDESVLEFIFSMLKGEFDKIIKENKFNLDSIDIQLLREKLKRIRLQIGNLPLSLNDTSINLYYSQIQLKEYNFYHNHLEMLNFRTWQQHQALFESSLTAASSDSFYVNDDISQLRNAPYFIHKHNIIIIPMVFLQLPFYHYDQHPVLQFSLVGWILAHELSHAFDNHGLDFDAWGNEKYAPNKLSANNAFNSTIQCLLAHSPAVSLNERMADVNGLQLAFQTFFQHVNENADTLLLKKLFFINFAQFFCGSLPRAIGHDSDDIRVRQSIVNMKEFAKVFQCSAMAKENPKRKCSIWRR